MSTLQPLSVEPIRRTAYRCEEAAESIGVSARTLARWGDAGPPSAIIGGVRLYPVADLARWLSERAAAESGGESLPKDEAMARTAAPRAGDGEFSKRNGKGFDSQIL